MVMQVPDIKNTMQTHGTFSTPSVLGAGDPFDKKGGSADLRLRGKPNFIGGPVPNNPHKGFQRLYEVRARARRAPRARSDVAYEGHGPLRC